MRLVSRVPRYPLSSSVSLLWLAEAYVAGPHQAERILPRGNCSLIIDLRARGNALVSGPHSTSFILSTSAQFAVAGAEFTPGGAFPFFDRPLRELANRHAALADCWGAAADELRERMLSASTAEQKLAVLEETLRRRLAHGRPCHGAVGFAIGEFLARPSVVRIGDVTERLGLSHRRFIELFSAEVGLTPKTFCRVHRFQRVLRRVHRQREIDWTAVALASGYYDQSHFIKDFSAFSGVNPSTYAALRGTHRNHLPLANR